MVLNKGLQLTKLLIKRPTCLSVQFTRNSGHWNYRTAYVPPRKNVIAAEIFGGFMWWWVLWHIFTEPGHIFGEFPMPDPSKWTDEELGIPPDDA